MDGRGWVLGLEEGAERTHPTLEPPKMGKQGAKRVGDGDGVLAGGTPPKKIKVSPRVRDGVLRGRPILQDVVNEGL